MTQIEVPPTEQEPAPERKSLVDKLFDLSNRGSTVAREVRGGITTFVAMAYIVLLNPLILGASADITGATLSTAQLTTATALSAAVMTVLMGLVGNAPLALAAGLAAAAWLACVRNWNRARDTIASIRKRHIGIASPNITAVSSREKNIFPLETLDQPTSRAPNMNAMRAGHPAARPTDRDRMTFIAPKKNVSSTMITPTWASQPS